MNSERKTILVVDDSRENRMLLRMMLENQYHIEEAESGEQCLSMIDQRLPNLVLLDVNMPGMNGYHVCQQLRTQLHTQTLPIIFVSALDSTEERLAGFEAGGDEYVIKPIDGQDLLNKVASCLQRQEETLTAHHQASEAMRIALEAMTVSSELGQIIDFIRKGHDIKTISDIGNAVLQITADYNLHASVMIVERQQYFFGCNSNSTEANFLRQASLASERIVSKGIRTIIKNDNIVLLLKNMPIDDESRTGRLKDHLAVVMDIADNYVIKVNVEQEARKQRHEFVDKIIGLTQQQINFTSNKLKEQQHKSQQLTEHMIDSMEEMLLRLGLESDQEQALLQLASDTSEHLHQAAVKSDVIDQQLNLIVEHLQDFQRTSL